MHLTILDPNVGIPMNVFLIIGNIINLIQNIPQVIKTYKIKTTGDFSGWSLLLRVVSNIIWTAYAIEINSVLMIINNTVTIVTTSYIGYYKINDILNNRKKFKYIQYINSVTNDDNLIIEKTKKQNITYTQLELNDDIV